MLIVILTCIGVACATCCGVPAFFVHRFMTRVVTPEPLYPAELLNWQEENRPKNKKMAPWSWDRTKELVELKGEITELNTGDALRWPRSVTWRGSSDGTPMPFRAPAQVIITGPDGSHEVVCWFDDANEIASLKVGEDAVIRGYMKGLNNTYAYEMDKCQLVSD